MKLALPFALVGAAPFAVLGLPGEAAVAAVAMGVAGAVLRQRVDWRSLGCATTVAGGLAGLVCGSFAAGVLLGLAALFPLRLVAWAAEGGAARRGSVLDAVDVRQAWGVAAVLVTIVPAPLLSLAPDLPGLVFVYGLGLFVLMGVAIADLIDFHRLTLLAAEASAGVIAPLSAVQREVPVADVGVGNQQHERRQPGAPYRGGDQLLSVVRGDAGDARRRLAGRLFLDLGLIAVTAWLFAIAAGVLHVAGVA